MTQPNELGINTLTMTAFCRVIPAKQKPILFNLCARDGATVDMLVERVQHYLHAVSAQRAGLAEARKDRQMVDVYTDPITHNEARVTIFGVEWIPPRRANDFEPCINVFTEFSTAQDVLDRVGLFKKAFAVLEIEHGIKCNTPDKSPKESRKTAPRQPSEQKPARKPAQKAPSERKKVQRPPQPAKPEAKNPLTRAATRRRAAASHRPEPPPVEYDDDSDSDTPYLGGYDYKREEEYRQHEGSPVKFDVTRIRALFDPNSGEPYLEVFSSYDGRPSKYHTGKWPSSGLNIKQERLAKCEAQTAEFLQDIIDSKGDMSGNWIGTYWASIPDPQTGKFYLSIIKLETDEVEAPPPLPPARRPARRPSDWVGNAQQSDDQEPPPEREYDVQF